MRGLMPGVWSVFWGTDSGVSNLGRGLAETLPCGSD
jgi:hypothetical protein